MDRQELYERFLEAYTVYYNVQRENVTEPFDAEAVFQAKNEQYFLIKSAKIAEIQANEYVFFASRDHLTMEELGILDQKAWDEAMSRITPNPNHKSSDATLIVIADTVDPLIGKNITGYKHAKSYKAGFWGFSNYKLVVIEASSGNASYNRQGRDLKKLVTDIMKNK